MAVRTVNCTLINATDESLTLTSSAMTAGAFRGQMAPNPTVSDQALWGCESTVDEGAISGTATYTGAGGTVTVNWSVPVTGANAYSGTATGGYEPHLEITGEQVGADPQVCFKVWKAGQDAAGNPVPPASTKNEPADHSQAVHVPTTSGGPGTVSVKKWLVDVAWQSVNNMEWDALVLEMTENRHGAQHGGACPGTLPVFDDVKESGACQRDHAGKFSARVALWKPDLMKSKKLDDAGADAYARANDRDNPNYNDFHSWCGDFVSWVFWKAWVLQGKPEDKVTKAELGKFLNRETLNGAWASGENLSMVEAYARDMTLDDFKLVFAKTVPSGVTRPKLKKQGDPSKLLCWYDFPGGYSPSPGDMWLSNRPGGGHIGIVASAEPGPPADPTSDPPKLINRAWDFVTIDGKSFDNAWNAELEAVNKGLVAAHRPVITTGAQGVCQNQRTSGDMITVGKDSNKADIKALNVRGFIDTKNLREALGYR